ncbi:hypothetical protein DNTS_018837 [Danionella cerebrum]|uniref:VLIG-type G domain-containing protein n=1 Tax=Danionella cerebrum TaxID=2873325 RepID=A0A553RNW1_9TELE|nr:hypothetical protein DNTS_018837 [Danionella translucida]
MEEEEDKSTSSTTSTEERLRSQQTPRKCLEDVLDDLGLERSYWSKVIRDELQVTNLKQLQHLDDDDIQDLVKHTRYRWEEKALKKLISALEKGTKADETGISSEIQDGALEIKVEELETSLMHHVVEPSKEQMASERTMKGTAEGTGQSTETSSVLDVFIPIVSFIRLGSSENSKSKILNDIVNKNGHPTFFNRHCSGSTQTRLLLDGVAEMSWYLPGGKKTDIFVSCMSFINLHGDGCTHPQQLEFLTGISSVIVLLLPENIKDPAIQERIQYFIQSKTPMIALFSGLDSKNKVDAHRIAAKNRNEAELTQELILKINQSLSNESHKQLIKEAVKHGRKQGFVFETETEVEGRKKVKALMEILYGENTTKEKENTTGLKDRHLPLQGDLWKQWSIKDKEFHCIKVKKNISLEQQRSQIDQDKKKIRADQCERSNENIFMKMFLQYVIDAEEEERMYFLHGFKKSLNEAFTDNLLKLKRQYNKKWLKLRETSKEDRKKHQADLDEISNRAQHATLALVFREISQIYECNKCLGKDEIHGIKLEKLPEIGAELMLCGHPLELIDGDVNHVPIDWVTAVLEKLLNKLGNKKVLVVSAVGLQSSGKSTLLNTMFGLNFEVSSGPCTRGAFMHLLPVEQPVKDEVLYEYVLILDTEGLRSTEANPHDVIKKDNELATLIIAISDLTLINIMGENLSEIQNILQVCFQAFLRMKKVRVAANCIFVHQNVSDIAAKEKNQEGRIKLIEKLNEISKAAAEEENQVVSGFNDIIKFDVNNDVLYFKTLLEGDPPMAPPNPSYSQNVQDLKKKVLSVSTWHPKYSGLSLFELIARLKDTWAALLNENFVFNFRNSLELKVYRELEEEFQRWSWKLRKMALETQRTLNCQVKSLVLKEINKSELKSSFNQIHTSIKCDADKYFRESNHPDILSQWRVLIDRKLEILKEELINETHEAGLKEINIRKLKSDLDEKLRKYETDLVKKGIEFASAQHENDQKEDLIKEQFSQLWIKWTTDLSSKKPKETETNMEIMVENTLLSRFEKHKDAVCKKLEEDFQFDANKHIKWGYFQFSILKKESTEIVTASGNRISKNIVDDISKRIEKKAAEDNEVTENFIQEILEEINERIKNHEKSLDFHFTSLYEASISAFICKTSTRKFREINERCKSENDPLEYMKKKKEHFRQLFRGFCRGAESVQTFVSVFMENLQEAMLHNLYDRLSTDTADHLRNHHTALRGNKANLENHILRHLAEKQSFEDYMEYLHKPKSFTREFIRECVEKYLSDEHTEVLRKMTSNWSQLTQTVLTECSSVSENIRKAQGNLSKWLDELCLRLGQQIPLSRESFRTVENIHIDEAEKLQQSLTTSLNKVLDRAKNPRGLIGSGPIIFKLKEKPVDILFKQLSGCWEQCPFCKAVCTETISNHETPHSVECHRSQAVGGVFHQNQDEKHFALEFCSTAVISNNQFKALKSEKWFNFKTYQDAGPPYSRWKITADNEDRCYWKWFICTFSKELESQYPFKFEGSGKIPETWKEITKERVIQEINDIIEKNRENERKPV